jgi:hypothetical protein
VPNQCLYVRAYTTGDNYIFCGHRYFWRPALGHRKQCVILAVEKACQNNHYFRRLEQRPPKITAIFDDKYVATENRSFMDWGPFFLFFSPTLSFLCLPTAAARFCATVLPHAPIEPPPSEATRSVAAPPQPFVFPQFQPPMPRWGLHAPTPPSAQVHR